MLPEQLPFIQYCSDSMMFTGVARRARNSSCIFYHETASKVAHSVRQETAGVVGVKKRGGPSENVGT